MTMLQTESWVYVCKCVCFQIQSSYCFIICLNNVLIVSIIELKLTLKKKKKQLFVFVCLKILLWHDLCNIVIIQPASKSFRFLWKYQSVITWLGPWDGDFLLLCPSEAEKLQEEDGAVPALRLGLSPDSHRGDAADFSPGSLRSCAGSLSRHSPDYEDFWRPPSPSESPGRRHTHRHTHTHRQRESILCSRKVKNDNNSLRMHRSIS